MILGMLISMMVLTNCDSSQCMKDYYTTNKDSLVEIRRLSQTLAGNYDFQVVTIIKKRGQVELGFDGEIGAASMYLNPSDLSLIHEFPNSKCSPEELQRFRTMYQDNDLREILNLFEAIEPKAITISHGGVFVALGKTLQSPNPNLKGGILMTYEPEPSNSHSRIVEQIDTNVYLYDDLVY
ncbi:MAG TPA: hypothetical protein VGK59_13570 [Ohtaekwangia sp.]